MDYPNTELKESDRFVVDAMLGRLARWLRILGYDAIYSPSMEDWRVLKIAEKERRKIITRDRGIYVRAKKRGLVCFTVPPEYDVVHSLAYLKSKGVIDLHYPFSPTRCTNCNGILERIGLDRWRCTGCGKEYWKGSHWKSIEKTIIKASIIRFPGEESDPAHGKRGEDPR
jgi:uncharacterized protein with PIN domain